MERIIRDDFLKRKRPGKRRIYEGSPKHKWPGGWGSVCPTSVGQVEAQLLLDEGVENTKGDVYNVFNGQAYEGRQHRPGKFHGYPVKGSEVPPDVLRKLRDDSRITQSEYNRLRREA